MTATEGNLTHANIMDLPEGTYLMMSSPAKNHNGFDRLNGPPTVYKLISCGPERYGVEQVDLAEPPPYCELRDSCELSIEVGILRLATIQEIEEAKRQRERNLIVALEARMAADKQAFIDAKMRLRMLDPNTTV